MRAWAWRVVGDDAALAAGEADRRHAQLVQRHRQQRHRDPLAAGEQHVQLAARGIGRHLLGQREQLVGGVAHGRDHHHQLVALGARGPSPRAATLRIFSTSATEEPPYFWHDASLMPAPLPLHRAQATEADHLLRPSAC